MKRKENYTAAQWRSQSLAKKFKNRNTTQNKNALIEAESQFENAKLNAMYVWSNSLIDKFENTCDPRERWTIYKQMINKQTDHSVLSLIDLNSDIAFDNRDKCNVLQGVFFFNITNPLSELTVPQ